MDPLTAAQDADHRITEITPRMAEEWLGSQFKGQRGLRDHHVILLAQEMENGTFIAHSSIVFAELNNVSHLIDGQHRLNAIVLYDKPVRMPVLRKTATSMKQVQEWYASIDQGLRRTARDAIRAQGIPQELELSERHAGRLSGAVKLIATGFADVTAKNAAVRAAGRVQARSNAAVSGLMRLWSKEARTYFSLIHGGEPTNMYLFDRAPVVACGLLTIRHMPDKAADFWREIARDSGLSREDARKRFLVFLRDKKERPPGVVRGFAPAWRAFVEGRSLDLLRPEKSTSPIMIKGVPLDKEIATAARISKIEEVNGLDLEAA